MLSLFTAGWENARALPACLINSSKILKDLTWCRLRTAEFPEHVIESATTQELHNTQVEAMHEVIGDVREVKPRDLKKCRDV